MPETIEGIEYSDEEVKRIRKRGDATDLVGTVTCTDKDGNEVPLLDDDGMEILGIATGENWDPSLGLGEGS